jgi:hypothetical protein
MGRRTKRMKSSRRRKRRAYDAEQCSNYKTGGEVLHLSNPGDYPLNEDDRADFDVIEVDA